MEASLNNENPLGILPEGELLRKFAVPSVISMLVGSLYNIVDQFFIGNTVGELGNAATNIAFPFSTLCVAIALLCGIGGSSKFNLAMGGGQGETAGKYVGNASVIMLVGGAVLSLVTMIFLEPLLLFFGSPENVLPLAEEYVSITALGFPFLIFSTGGGHLVRADGSPKMTMTINLTGAIVNTVLDWLFVFVLGWGMRGAAIATVVGQVIASMLVVWYFTRFKTARLDWSCFKPEAKWSLGLLSLGVAPCFNQLAMSVVQIVMNKTLKYYGAQSVYGESIPIACSGIVAKVTMVVFAFIIGISQGLQPIVSFNYGAGKYDRVKKGYFLALKLGAVICVVAFALFQIFPREIISIFGNGSDLYYEFSVKYMRIYLFFIILGFMQPIAANFFTAIGKPQKGIFMSLTRQIIFLLPLIIIFPIFMGIDGVMYAGPIADFLAALVCTVLVIGEMRKPEFRKSTAETQR